jgi:hypothetical protein
MADRTFADGYVDGWNSVMGKGTMLPGIPMHSIPMGKTPYQHGFDRGIADATKRKAENESRSSN